MNDKEAIERLNRFKTIKVMYGNTFVMHLEQLKQLQQDLETILNLIENQKAEIEKKDKEIKCLKCLHNTQVEIIDLMAEEFVSKTLMYSDMTKEEVKEYFGNKAEEEK